MIDVFYLKYTYRIKIYDVRNFSTNSCSINCSAMSMLVAAKA